MIGIVGLGVIGGSYAMALKAAGLGPVAGMDVDQAALDQALAMGIIQQGGRPDKALLGQCHLVIIALYPALVPGFLAEHRDHFRENCLITDATGVKYQLSLKLEGLLRPDVDFVMGHPMAGREKMGLAFASAQVFQGANYILVPTPRNREENLRRVEALARALGFASVRRVDPQTHDQLIAYTSQLPHAMAVALHQRQAVGGAVPGKQGGAAGGHGPVHPTAGPHPPGGGPGGRGGAAGPDAQVHPAPGGPGLVIPEKTLPPRRCTGGGVCDRMGETAQERGGEQP